MMIPNIKSINQGIYNAQSATVNAAGTDQASSATLVAVYNSLANLSLGNQGYTLISEPEDGYVQYVFNVSTTTGTIYPSPGLTIMGAFHINTPSPGGGMFLRFNGIEWQTIP